MASTKGEQKVMVIKTNVLFPKGIKEGIITENKEELLVTINKHAEYKKRLDVEENEDYQQIIPQIVLKCGQKIFIHRIPKTGNEGRLHDMWPIFLGGHVDDTDKDIAQATEREFKEEINYKGLIVSKQFIGLVKLHDTPVNRVHVGLIWLYEGNSENYETTSDNGLIDGKFVTLSELEYYRNSLTYWSKAFLPYLTKI